MEQVGRLDKVDTRFGHKLSNSDRIDFKIYVLSVYWRGEGGGGSLLSWSKDGT